MDPQPVKTPNKRLGDPEMGKQMLQAAHLGELLALEALQAAGLLPANDAARVVTLDNGGIVFWPDAPAC